MSTESFEQVMAEMADKVASPYWTDMAERLKRAYARAIRDTAQQQYSRGYHDGKHSMDAEHRAVAMRLRQLPLDGGSHENLSQIARAVYHADFGWTQGACVALRDELVRLMGGVSEPSVADVAKELMDTIIEEGNERLQNDGKAEKPSITEAGDDTCGAGCGCAAVDCGGDCAGEHEEVGDERLADDSGADTGCGDGGGDLHMAGVRITDELREWANDGVWSCRWEEFKAIADRIDEQFDRICAQQEAVLQETIERMADENLTAKDERDHWKREASELRAKLGEYDSTHIELPRDANGEVFRVDGGARVNDLVLTIRQMTLTKDGWKIRAYDEDYEVEREASFFDACAPKPDLIEETIEKLTLGEITQSEAIERIKSSHGTARRE